MSKQFTKEFKEYAVIYYHEHKDLGYTVSAKINDVQSKPAWFLRNRF